MIATDLGYALNERKRILGLPLAMLLIQSSITEKHSVINLN